MTPFEAEVLADLKHSIAEVRDSDMDKQAKIVCLTALYALGWMADNEKEVLQHCMFHVFEALTGQGPT